jgi:sec-independent protein translocase protein TatA
MPAFIGIQEIVVLMLVLLFVFAAKRLPEIGRSLGLGMREFKNGITGEEREPHDRHVRPVSRQRRNTR